MPPTQPPQGGAKFFIGGLNRSTTDEALYNHFEPFGEITDCVVIKAANVSRGFGFVVFANKDELKENGFYTVTEHIIDDKRVEVKAAVPPSEAELQNQQKPKETETPCNRLFIGSLDSETTLETLTNYFSTYGTLVDALLPRDAEGKSRGFGFVAYSTTDAAETVLSRDHHIDGKQVCWCLTTYYLGAGWRHGGPRKLQRHVRMARAVLPDLRSAVKYTFTARYSTSFNHSSFISKSLTAYKRLSYRLVPCLLEGPEALLPLLSVHQVLVTLIC